jgi:cell division protein ZapA
MAQVSVTIAGKVYRMACGDGEELHLESLAAIYDARISEMHGAFGEIGDMRLHVMAAISLADESADLRRRIGALEQKLSALSGDAGSAESRADDIEQKAAAAIGEAAARIERVARALGGHQGQG